MLSRLLTRKEQAVLLLFGAAVVIGAGVLWVTNARTSDGIVHIEPAAATASPPAAPILDPPPDATASAVAERAHAQPPADPTPAQIVVSVQGAVAKPGVYTLHEGDRVQDLLEDAGNALEGADLTNINLAAKLVDGTTLVVPNWNGNDYWSYQSASNPPHYTIRQQTAAPAAPVEQSSGIPAGNVSSGSRLINLNTATQDALESLPGIGPTYAREIIRFREQSPFRTVDDVAQVRGIGPKRLEAIRPLVTVE